MRRMLFIFATACATAALAVPAALADSPHFITGPNYTATTTALTATGKAAGLGNSPGKAFLTATRVDVYFHCVNHGRNFAPGHPATVSPATGPVQNFTPHNGGFNFNVSLPAPVPSAATECPNANWSVVVDEVDYLGVVLHIQTQLPDGSFADILTDGPHDFTTCSAGFGQCIFTG